jgi:putative aldouronate transport system substrate-binding protein
MKWITKLGIVALIVVLAAGCSGGNKGSSNGSGKNGEATNKPSASSEPSATANDEPIEIAWLSFNFPAEDGSIGQKYIEEKFNVKIKNIRIDRANWKDQLNVRLASDELPDVWLLWGIADVNAYSGQNLLAELPIDEIKAKMPSLAKLVDDNNPAAWSNGLINGKNYGIPITNVDGIYPLLPYYNENWLKAIGYDAPPTTLEELEDVIYKFRNNDPDQNSKKDTYGLTGKGSLADLNQSFPYVFGAFDVQPQFWVEDGNGGLAYGMTTENAREAFKLLNKWFKDGVLDPEFITADGNKKEFENGLVGVKFDQWNYQRPTLRKQIKETDSTYFPTIAGTQVAAPEYTGHGMAWGLTGNYMGMGVDVDKTPGKREKIYEILNAAYSDPEVMKYLNFGEEGVHHDLVNGLPVIKTEMTADKLNNLGIGAYYGILSSKSLEGELLRYPTEDLEWRKQVVKDIPLMYDQVKFNIPSASQFPDIKNMESEYFIKFITGDVDLDSGFDDFIGKWKKAGGEVLTKEVNEIYATNQK